MSFKANPYANPSVGAPTPTGYNISGAERLAAGALTTGTNPIHSAADPALAAAQFTDKGIEVADGSVVRVVLGDLGGGVFGLELFQSDGSTAIIDGTSDMFRISTTGTLSVSTVNGDRNVTVTTGALTGLGALTDTPCFIGMVGSSNASTGNRWSGSSYGLTIPGSMFVATSSGGSPTNNVINLNRWEAQMYVGLDGSNFAVVTLESSNQSGSSHTAYARYYILAQAAI